MYTQQQVLQRHARTKKQEKNPAKDKLLEYSKTATIPCNTTALQASKQQTSSSIVTVFCGARGSLLTSDSFLMSRHHFWPPACDDPGPGRQEPGRCSVDAVVSTLHFFCPLTPSLKSCLLMKRPENCFFACFPLFAELVSLVESSQLTHVTEWCCIRAIIIIIIYKELLLLYINNTEPLIVVIMLTFVWLLCFWILTWSHQSYSVNSGQ